MGLKAKIRNCLKRPNKKEQAILRHDDALCKYLQIGIDYTDIVDQINAFDWLDISQASNEKEFADIVMKFYKRFNIKTSPAFEGIVAKAFTHKFVEAVKYLKDAIESTNSSYNIEGNSKGFQNANVNKLYYISYWAEKMSIPVNFNEKRQENRALFNLDTIILSILADKLNAFNAFERSKPKK